MKNNMLNILKEKTRNKKGNEVLQTLIIIAIIGGLTISVITAFTSELKGSLGGKIKDSEWQSTADLKVAETKKEMGQKQTIDLSHY